jgi:alanine dehydrogenase
MKIGIPVEIKPNEGRVALVPSAAGELVAAGHEVWIQSGAGEGSGYRDEDFAAQGVRIVPDAASLYGAAEMIVKVKEPIAPEFPLLREDHLLFCFLHLAAIPDLADVLVGKRLRAVAFETVEEGGRLPILAPMSEIAGRLATQIGTTLLYRYNQGRGVMLGGLAAAGRGHVVVLGGGNVGLNAADVAASLGARVTVLSRGRDSLLRAHALGPNVTALSAYPESIRIAVKAADLLVGAVLVAGARAPSLVDRKLVAAMKSGSVIVDVAVDQGGCVETIHPTTYASPTYLVDGVIHFGVTNMPGAVPRTSSEALSSALTPYVLRLAADPEGDEVLSRATNVADGRIVHPAVAASLRDRPST